MIYVRTFTCVFQVYHFYSRNFHTFWPNFLSRMVVQNLCDEFLEGIVLEANFRLGPELGIPLINLK
jgi:hypothetical protein